MLGAIIGDTVGSVYEFHNTKDYNFPLFSPHSSFTDDSVMSFAVAQWLLKDPDHTHEELEKAMVAIAYNNNGPRVGYGPKFYKWLFYPEALPECADGARRPYNSFGNGSAMRVSPCGWFFDTLEETQKVAAISASITHNHPEGIKGAQATATAIWMARNGKSKEEIRQYMETVYGYDLSHTYEEYNRWYEFDVSCQGTLPPALVCFLESKDFEDAIRKAVSVGGDSDTLACITGGIAEAFYGLIPPQMADPTLAKLPAFFKEILSEMKARTAYGKAHFRG